MTKDEILALTRHGDNYPEWVGHVSLLYWEVDNLKLEIDKLKKEDK